MPLVRWALGLSNRIWGCGELLVRVRRDVPCDAVVRKLPYRVRHGCDGKGDGPSNISSSDLL